MITHFYHAFTVKLTRVIIYILPQTLDLSTQTVILIPCWLVGGFRVFVLIFQLVLIGICTG